MSEQNQYHFTAEEHRQIKDLTASDMRAAMNKQITVEERLATAGKTPYTHSTHAKTQHQHTQKKTMYSRRNKRKRFYLLDDEAYAHWKSLGRRVVDLLPRPQDHTVEQAPRSSPVLGNEALVHAADEHK